ncbi:MAG: hypothetical protein COA82_12325 [Alkaliphilus sp.]|nr:MAG: hypothetical protein COA82_12325 [Alkaliphilus sp.]
MLGINETAKGKIFNRKTKRKSILVKKIPIKENAFQNNRLENFEVRGYNIIIRYILKKEE